MPTDPHLHKQYRTTFLMGVFWLACLAQADSFAQDLPVLSLRQLAEVQQWQDELQLQERLEQLQQRKSRPAQRQVAVTPSESRQAKQSAPGTEAASTKRTAAPHKRPSLTLLSVYGPARKLNAEAMDRQGGIHALAENARIGSWVVTHIRQEGVLLHRDAEQTGKGHPVFLNVGESMDDGVSP